MAEQLFHVLLFFRGGRLKVKKSSQKYQSRLPPMFHCLEPGHMVLVTTKETNTTAILFLIASLVERS